MGIDTLGVQVVLHGDVRRHLRISGILMDLKEAWNPESVPHTLCCFVIVNYGPSNEKWEAWNQERSVN
jgi:hypothetical protein